MLGKTIIWNGDSICQGTQRDGCWAKIISEKYSMVSKNYAVGGGTIAQGLPKLKSGNERYSISRTVDLMYEEYPDADYVIFEGGTNDADLLGFIVDGEENAFLGKVDPSYFGEEYDKNTFAGALESIFSRAVRYWTDKKIGFIIAQKMGMDKEEFLNRRKYFDTAAEICKKWGIPCLDLWNGCHLNPYVEEMYPIDENGRSKDVTKGFYTDGQHLNANGYEYTALIIEKWLLSL